MKRVIALVDCNNFFVACERLHRPELLDKPVCVLSNNDGCVVSRSNEAKRLGVQMGAPYFIVKNQFKNVTFLSGNLPFYCEISTRVMQKLKDFTPDVEIYSIDEAFLDLTGLRKTFNCSYEEIIKKIVIQIKEEIGIDVSVGMSYSKVLAKLASDKAKNIQKNLKRDDVNARVYKIGYRQIQKELKETLIGDIWGIGKNTNALLKKHLIQTAYDFVAQDDIWLKKNLGKVGLDLKQELLGNALNLVDSSEILPKSVSRSESFKEFQTDKNFIQEELNSHIHKVCKKLRKHCLNTNCVEVFLRTKDFQVFSQKQNLTMPTNVEFELVNFCKKMLDELFLKNVIYRSVGFCALKLTSSKHEQISLFDSETKKKQQNLSYSWDKLEEKYGKGVIKLGKI